MRTENLTSGVDWLWGLAISVAGALVYATTLCPTVSFTDAGELAGVAVQLGIAHPTGYPLFTLLGRFVLLLNVGQEPIRQLNAWSMVVTAAAGGMMFLAAVTLLRSRLCSFVPRSGRNDTPTRIAAAFGVSTLMLSTTVWSQATSLEVYALHLLLVSLVLFSLIKGVEVWRESQVIPGELFLFAFLLGLSFANHMTTVLLLPGCAYLFAVTARDRSHAMSTAIVLIPLFALGLSLYLYLPIRSSAHPLLDWGHPASWSNFWTHISGRQYRVWMFSGSETMMKQLKYFVSNVPNEFVAPALLALGAGVVVTFRRSRRVFIFLGLLIGTDLAYSVNYDIHDIDSYFLLAYLASAFFVSIAAMEVVRRWGDQRLLHPMMVLLAVAVVLYQGISNRSRVDQSDNRSVEQTTRAIMANVDSGALVLASTWDYFVSPMFYYQAVGQDPKHIVLIDKSLLQNRVWYVENMRRQQQWAFGPATRETDLFLVELRKFEAGEPFNPAFIQARWDGLLRALVTVALDAGRAVYVDYRIEPEFPPQFARIPSGLLVRLDRKILDISPIPDVEIHPQFIHTAVGRDLVQYVSGAAYQQGAWSRGKGREEMAQAWFRLAARVNPQFEAYIPDFTKPPSLQKNELPR